MKIKIEMEFLKEHKELLETEPTDKEIKEELKQMLFEVCEDWVLRGQQPSLKFIRKLREKNDN